MPSLKNVMVHALVLLIGIVGGVYFSRSMLNLGWACPVPSSWGSCFDGLTVFVGLLNAVAITYLSWQANRISLSVNNQQKEHDFREANILLSYIAPELRDVRIPFAVVQHLIEQASHQDAFSRSKEVRGQISGLVSGISLALTKSILPRMHVLPEKVGASLSELLGTVNSVIKAAEASALRETPGSTQAMFGNLMEPEVTSEEMRAEFKSAYAVIKTGSSLVISEIDRLLVSKDIMRSV